jgi:ParB family chromosome partitioning protein
MRLSLGDIGAKAAETEALRAALASGAQANALAADLFEPSFVIDRLDAERVEPDFEAFIADIRDHGQQTPILARPHPSEPGRYQIAFGHRRWRAARALGRPVTALIRPLSDEELVVAQGQENAQRRDLSFIEKAFFARALDERGFSRATLVAALAVQTAEVTRLLAVARDVPAELARAIGPAPKAGRPRWMALVEALKQKGALTRALRAAEQAGDSDARFAAAFLAATAKPQESAQPDTQVLTSRDGAIVVRVTRRGNRARLEFDADLAPDLLAALLETAQQKLAAR